MNLFKKAMPVMLVFLIAAWEPAAAKKLKAPEDGQKPGAVGFGIFMAKLDPSKPYPIPVDGVRIVAASYSEINGGKTVAVSSKENINQGIGRVYLVESNFEPGKEYVLNYIRLVQTVGKQETIYHVNLDTENTKNLFRIKAEPGKVKFMGVYCLCMVVEKSGNFILRDKGTYTLTKGFPVLDKMTGAKYPNKTYIMWLKQDVYWKEEHTPKGAERNFFDNFMKRNKKVAYWYDIAATRRNELN